MLLSVFKISFENKTKMKAFFYDMSDYAGFFHTFNSRAAMLSVY